MSYVRDSSENAVHLIVGNGAVESWIPISSDSSVWATEDDYPDDIPSNSNSSYQSQTRPNGEQPPNKKSRNSSQDVNSKSKAIGKMFFKTKLCCKFRSGTCPYISNCNFAHSIEELRRPPPNWQEIVAAHEEEKGSTTEIPREEFQIPSIGSTNFTVETQRSYKGRHCKKFYTEEGCPYGENCTFVHDEQNKNRESVAISLGPGGYGGGAAAAIAATSVGVSNVKPSNWKTRICNKWELTGYCPFGSKCHFAHGVRELHRFGGSPMESENKESAAVASDTKQTGVALKTPVDTVVASVTSASHADIYHVGVGVPSQRSSIAVERSSQRSHHWKGPDKISRIYGDWIDDIE